MGGTIPGYHELVTGTGLCGIPPGWLLRDPLTQSLMEGNRDSGRVKDMSHVTEAGLGALAPYPFLLLGVSWMGCLPEA